MSFVRSLTRKYIHAAKEKKLEVLLGAADNPDFDSPTPVIAPHKVRVKSMEEAQQVVRDFIDSNDIGGGGWYLADAGWVFENGRKVARIAYNGNIIEHN